MKKMSILSVFILTLGFANPVAIAHAETPATAPAQTQTTSHAPATKGNTASAVVKNFYSQLVDTMKQGDKLGFAGREKKLTPAVKAAFNLPLMTRFAVGSSWANATPAEQKQLISAFSDFSVANYASRFASYDGEQFQVIDEKPTAGGIIVETSLTPKEGDPVALNYLVRKDEKGRMRIVDVFLNGSISELAARRSEFGAIVQRDGIPALVNSLDEKSKQMGPS
jgi:phospholipid transport system substrate-binding protein